MGSKENRLRKKWQDYSAVNANIAESDFYNTLKILFEDTEYKINEKPKDFINIYVDVILDDDVISEIYNPQIEITRHGIIPDYSIENTITKKIIFVDVKHQDGWVDGKKRSAGRGNAHERACKYFTPGLLKLLREKGNLSNKILPFFTVFVGDITRDPCRVREITFWYDDYKGHFFFWRDTKNPIKLIDHIENYILPLLD